MTSGLGIRWAVNGPLMTNVLGGGRNFGHFIDHIGPAVHSWKVDMHKYEYNGEPEQKERLKERVGEYVEGVDLDAVEEKRDEFILNCLQLKST